MVDKPKPTQPQEVKTIDTITPMSILIMKGNKAGRPTDMTIDTVTKLLVAFQNDYNISQACAYADIARQTYYRWCAENPAFNDKMIEAKDAPLRRAREVVVGAINAGDANLAFRFLERRDPEFKPKTEVDNNIGLQETREKIKEFLDDDDSAYGVGEQSIAADSSAFRGEVAEAPTDIS